MSRRRILAVVVLLLVAVATRWLVMRGDPSAGEPGLPTARSDYTLDDFRLTAMNTEGQPRFVLQAPRLERNPRDGSAVINTPHLDLYGDEAEATWEVDAATAWIREDGQEIRLEGDVALVRAAEPATRVDSPALTLYPDRQLATSTESVIIRHADNALSGIGLEARLDQNRWELLSNVKASFKP